MKRNCAIRWLSWLATLPFLLLGILLCSIIPGYSFSGLICFGITAVITCYNLLNLLQENHLMMAKVLRTILSTILLLGIAAATVTIAIIWNAGTVDTDTDCEYIVVLGAKVNGTEPSLNLSERIHAAFDYLSEHPGTIAVVSGGQGPDEGISEAQCMFRELVEMGIDPARIWLEDRATSTWENLNYSLDLIEEKTGIRPNQIGLVSAEYHMYRAGLMASDCGVAATGIPAPTRWLSLRINYYMREVAGVWYYILLGGS